MKLMSKEPLHCEAAGKRTFGGAHHARFYPLLYCASKQQLHSFERLTSEVMPFD